MSETLPYVEKALKIETTSMNNTHMGTVVECMTLDMEYEGAKFNLHQNRNTYYLSSSDEMVDFDAMLILCTRSITCRPSEAALDGPGPAAVKASVDEGMSSREPSSSAAGAPFQLSEFEIAVAR